MPRSSIPQVWGSIQRFEYCPTLFLFALADGLPRVLFIFARLLRVG